MLVVAARMTPEIDEFCGAHPGDVRIVLDPDDSLAELLNARWKPRVYVLNEGGQIAYVQPAATLDARADVRRLLTRSSL